MKIDYLSNPVNGVGQTPKTNKNKGFKELLTETVQKGDLGQDKSSVSSGAQTMAKAMGSLNGTSDVREAQIASLKSQIESGNYQINYEELSKRLSSLSWFS